MPNLGRGSSVLIKPLDGSTPCLWRSDFVVSLRRGVIEETMNRVRPDVTFVRNVVLLQFRLIRGPRVHQRFVETAVMHQYRRFDFCNIRSRRRAAVKRSGSRQVRTQQSRQSVGYPPAKAEACYTDFCIGERMG